MDSILVVEDEPLILSFVTEVLEMYGYKVRAFPNAQSAWQFIEGSAYAPRLLITDLQMPGEMDGLELARRLRDTMPNVPIVVASGFHEGMIQLASHDVHWLPKPFDIDHLYSICQKLAPRP